MPVRLTSLPLLALLLASLAIPASAKDKKKFSLPEYILRATTVLVVVSPDAGEPIDHPMTNATSRENVEKALMQWGRLRLVMEGEESDLVIAIRTGNSRAVQPTVKGGPIDQRPGTAQGGNGDIRIGGHQGQPPPLTDPTISPQNGPRIDNQIGPSEDSFEVYRGGIDHPLDSSPVWRYTAKDCLQAPSVTAVEEFRKAIAKAEQPPVPKKT